MMIRYRRTKRELEMCFVSKSIQSDKWIATEFSQLTNWFIDSFKVKYGFGVASYLGYPMATNNHRAIGLWFQQKMKQSKWPLSTLEELKQQVKMRVPAEYFH